MSRRLTIILGAASAVLIILVGAWLWFSRTLPVLTVATWSGAYGRAQANAIFIRMPWERSLILRSGGRRN